MPESYKVSVIIPCFNHGEFLPEAVASVVDCGRSDIELIVVDDGSTEERTCSEIDRLDRSGVRVIRQPNRGLAAARNAGISIASGAYILPLDADNRVRSGYFEHSIRILDTRPEIGVVYGDAQFIGTRQGLWNVGAFDENRLMTWNYIDACAVFRKSVWEENGGYDGTMPVQGFEDWDFWIGAIENGWKFAYVPEVLFDYRVASESMITRARAYEREVEKFVARKHGPMYREAWLRLARERQSARRTARRLGTLLKVRAGLGLDKNARMSWVPD